MAVKDYFRTLGIYEAPSMYSFMKRAKVSDTKSIDIIVEYIVPKYTKETKPNIEKKLASDKSNDNSITKTSTNSYSNKKESVFKGVEMHITYEAKPKGYTTLRSRFVKIYTDQDEAMLCTEKKIAWLKKNLPYIPKDHFIIRNSNRKNINKAYLMIVQAIKKDKIIRAEEEKIKKAEAINNLMSELSKITRYNQSKATDKMFGEYNQLLGESIASRFKSS